MNDVASARPGAKRPKRTRVWVAVVALVLLAGVALFFALRGPKNDLERLQGEWVIQVPRMDGSEGGTSGPPLMVRVTGDRLAYVAGGEERSFFQVSLNEAANPKEIVLTRVTPEGKAASAMNAQGKQEAVALRGVYRIEKATLKLALAPPDRSATTNLDDPPPLVQTLSRRK
jgi:uncharacterized protein (TIGR03067 family)